MFVMVGLPGAGKTTAAQEIERDHRALRLTPDEWMIPLFGEPEGDGKRDVLEGRFIWLTIRALRAGTNVVLDFGCWSRDERTALRSLAETEGANCELVYLPVDDDEQGARMSARVSTIGSTTVAITEVELAQFRQLFEVPDDAEIRESYAAPPPEGYESGRHGQLSAGRYQTDQ